MHNLNLNEYFYTYYQIIFFYKITSFNFVLKHHMAVLVEISFPWSYVHGLVLIKGDTIFIFRYNMNDIYQY